MYCRSRKPQVGSSGNSTSMARLLGGARRGVPRKAADVVAPETETGQAQRQAAAQAGRHRLEPGLAVAAPVDGIALAAGRARAGEHHRLALAPALAQQLEH